MFQAKDHGIPPKETNATVTIFINDYNDNTPQFTLNTYNASLKENAKSDTKV